MRRVYFHTRTTTAEVFGSERAHFAGYTRDLLWSILEREADESYRPSRLRNIVPEDHYAHSNWPKYAKYVFTGISDDPLKLGDQEISIFSMQLNTAYSLGNDAVKLAARLHGQCEIHAYVEGENRKWLADIIQQGRATGFYRDGAGWESVIKLLRRSSKEPVVTSYSVCDQFPNSHVAKFDHPIKDGEKDWDAWYKLPQNTRWEMAVKGLREGGGGLEMKPDNWQKFYFGGGWTAFKLLLAIGEK